MKEQMTDHLAMKVSITLQARKAVFKILHIMDGHTIDIQKIKIIGLFCHYGAKSFLLVCCYMNN